VIVSIIQPYTTFLLQNFDVPPVTKVGGHEKKFNFCPPNFKFVAPPLAALSLYYLIPNSEKPIMAMPQP
jgi:hypothetical protein